jgi:apolipoprotein N-acyltransferase
MGFWVVNLKWLGTVTWPGAVALSAYLSLYFGIFGAFAAGVGNPWRRSFKPAKSIRERIQESTRILGYSAVLAGFWCGLEWVRGWFLTGFGWNGLGVTFANHLVLAQSAEFIGVTGLAFLPVFMSAVAVQTARRFYLQFRANEVKMLHWDFASALVVIMLVFTVGTLRLSSATNTPKIKGRVLLVQQDIPQVAGQITWEAQRIVDGFIELTEKGLAEVEAETARKLQEAAENSEGAEVIAEIASPDLLVWPEACLPEYFQLTGDGQTVGGPIIESIVSYVTELRDWTLVTGINQHLGEDPMNPGTEFYNSLLMNGGRFGRQSYQKSHLVILGEYIPDLPFLHDLYEQAAGVRFFANTTPGDDFNPLKVEIDGREVGVMPSICFEDTVGRVMRRSVRKESQMIINVTNDGWFQTSEGAAQHFNNALFRCIELRRPMVRCANRGVTGVVSVTGSLTDPFSGEKRHLVDGQGSHFHRGFLLASVYVPAEGVVTLYAALGDWFAVTGLATGLLWLVFACFRGRKSRRATELGLSPQ